MTLNEDQTGSTVAPAPSTAPAPSPVRTATVLLLLVAALQLAIVVTNFVLPAVDGTVTAAGQEVGDSFATGMQVGVVIGAVLRLGLAALYVVMALSVRAGRTWPRTAAIVLAALGLLSLLLTGAGAALGAALGAGTTVVLPLVTVGVQVLALAALVAVVVLLFRAAARRWLADRAAQRRLAGSRPTAA